jgi:hypothetical protein
MSCATCRRVSRDLSVGSRLRTSWQSSLPRPRPRRDARQERVTAENVRVLGHRRSAALGHDARPCNSPDVHCWANVLRSVRCGAGWQYRVRVQLSNSYHLVHGLEPPHLSAVEPKCAVFRRLVSRRVVSCGFSSRRWGAWETKRNVRLHYVCTTRRLSAPTFHCVSRTRLAR